MAEINLGKVRGDEVTKQSITSALGFPVKEIVIISQSEYDVLLPHEQEDERLFFIKDKLGKIFYKKQLVWDLPWDGTFADPLVGQILFNAGLIADPTQSTKEELALITNYDLNGDTDVSEPDENNALFSGWNITKFPELQYFTGITEMEFTFDECYALIEAPIIPNGVVNMRFAFSRCSNLIKAPIIPNSVTNMSHTFISCNSLTEAPIIPDSVTNMEDTFNWCTSLNGKFIIEAVTPPTINQNTFRNVTVVSIKVPASSVQAYKTASGWSDYADKIFPI